MQYLVSINQAKALAWGLNAQQAMLFAFLYQVPSWADSRQIDGAVWFNIGKGKIIQELPLLTDKPDTAYRLMKQLRDAGLIDMTSTDNKTYMRLTNKAKSWNKAQGSEKNPTLQPGAEGSEKSPTHPGKISEGRKNIREGSEKSPTNQDTKIITPSLSDAGASEPNVFERAATQDDDGEPAADPVTARKTAMTLDWEPESETYQVACLQRGLAPDANVFDALMDFREHFAAQAHRTMTHAEWTRRFAKWIHENTKRQHAQQQTTGGNAHANRRNSTPKRRRTAQEARAAAEGRAPAPECGQTYDGEFSAHGVGYGRG
ncbi:DnaT-like ssDNA-binding domain-containing protein [Halomonas sp. HMF6819]|uniref:DnaT-like ssDNA-binding domain-containing protein n=1 Tax=Halomonas sp. HMF6819 TaxID=3373085 RepID=UPI003790B714